MVFAVPNLVRGGMENPAPGVRGDMGVVRAGVHGEELPAAAAVLLDLHGLHHALAPDDDDLPADGAQGNGRGGIGVVVVVVCFLVFSARAGAEILQNGLRECLSGLREPLSGALKSLPEMPEGKNYGNGGDVLMDFPSLDSNPIHAGMAMGSIVTFRNHALGL